MNLIDKDALVEEIEKQIELGKFKCQQSQENNDRESYVAWSEHIATCGKIFSFINTLEVKEVNEKSETIYRSKIIKVKCISSFDETWEKGKVYICEKWHHGDLNMDFWDVYYDYDNNPKYVQFSSIEMLEKEFAILRNDTLEVKEVDLEKEIKDYLRQQPIVARSQGTNLQLVPSPIEIARYAFELGLKARKEE
jgi:CRISPR/Cas system-associated protein Cas5 (RAMP superfamily)